MSGSDPPANPLLIKEWLDRTISGPFDGELSAFLREVSQVGGKGVTFPGVQVPFPPQPMDGDFHAYMSRVADAHVKGGGTHPRVVIPADLTIALMGWVEMRVMTALNTIAPDTDGEYVFGMTPEPAAAAAMGQAWMRMLTLQLGILLKPYLESPAEPAVA
ncbi:MAG: hypothetical protein ACRDSZ_06975 [Pseudonocardiaceae bacterium]